MRLKAVALLGRLFSHPSRQFAQEYPVVFSEFLKRFSDKVVEVRVAVVNCAKSFLEANPTGEQANEILCESRMVPNHPVDLLYLSPCVSHARRVVPASCVIAYLGVGLCLLSNMVMSIISMPEFSISMQNL